MPFRASRKPVLTHRTHMLCMAASVLAVSAALIRPSAAQATSCADLARQALPNTTFTTVQTGRSRAMALPPNAADTHYDGTGHERGRQAHTRQHTSLLPGGGHAASLL